MTTNQLSFIHAHRKNVIGDYIIIFSRSDHIGFSYSYSYGYEAFLVPVLDPITLRFENNYYVHGDTSNRIKICDRLIKKNGEPYLRAPLKKIRELATELMSTPEFIRNTIANKMR